MSGKSACDNGIDVPLFTSDGPGRLDAPGRHDPGMLPDRELRQPFRRSVPPRAANTGRKGRISAWSSGTAGSTTGEKSTTPAPPDDVAQRARRDAENRRLGQFLRVLRRNQLRLHRRRQRQRRPAAADYAPTVTSYDYDAPAHRIGRPDAEILRLPGGHPQIPPRRAVRHSAPRSAKPPTARREADRKRPAARSSSTGSPPNAMNRCGRRPWRRAARTYGFIHYRTETLRPVRSNTALLSGSARPGHAPELDGELSGDGLPQRRRTAGFRAGQNRAGGSGARSAGRKHRTHQLRTARRAGPARDCRSASASTWQIADRTSIVWNLELDDTSKVAYVYGPFSAEENPAGLPSRLASMAPRPEPTPSCEFPGVKGVVWINGFNHRPLLEHRSVQNPVRPRSGVEGGAQPDRGIGAASARRELRQTDRQAETVEQPAHFPGRDRPGKHGRAGPIARRGCSGVFVSGRRQWRPAPPHCPRRSHEYRPAGAERGWSSRFPSGRRRCGILP